MPDAVRLAVVHCVDVCESASQALQCSVKVIDRVESGHESVPGQVAAFVDVIVMFDMKLVDGITIAGCRNVGA